ncbi:MAG: hypothetical protein HOO67_03635 [Candidatus Peribacteraceae bacterium]|nr:hypothetical protein [Candidatus Peribacteraceae bacterium]
MSTPKQETPHEGISTLGDLSQLSSQIREASPAYLAERVNGVNLMHEDYAAYARTIAPQYPQVPFPQSYESTLA